MAKKPATNRSLVCVLLVCVFAVASLPAVEDTSEAIQKELSRNVTLRYTANRVLRSKQQYEFVLEITKNPRKKWNEILDTIEQEIAEKKGVARLSYEISKVRYVPEQFIRIILDKGSALIEARTSMRNFLITYNKQKQEMIASKIKFHAETLELMRQVEGVVTLNTSVSGKKVERASEPDEGEVKSEFKPLHRVTLKDGSVLEVTSTAKTDEVYLFGVRDGIKKVMISEVVKIEKIEITK